MHTDFTHYSQELPVYVTNRCKIPRLFGWYNGYGYWDTIVLQPGMGAWLSGVVLVYHDDWIYLKHSCPSWTSVYGPL